MGEGAEVEINDSRDMAPAEMGDICDRILLASQIRMASKTLIQHRESSIAQLAVSFDGGRIFLAASQFEVNALAYQRPDAGGMKQQPVFSAR